MSVVAPILPEITKINEPYFEGAKAGELRVQHCADCGQYVFPPGPRCPRCLSAALEWVAVSGRGVLWSWIVMHQAYFPDIKSRLPYEVGFVRLDEGPLMMTNLVQVGDAELRCDMPVEVVFEQVGPQHGPANGTEMGEDVVIPVFRPASATASRADSP